MRAYWPRLLWLGLLMGKLWVDDGTFRDVGSRRKVARRALLRFSEMPTSPTWESDLVDRLGWSHRYDHALIEWVPKIDHDWNELNWHAYAPRDLPSPVPGRTSPFKSNPLNGGNGAFSPGRCAKSAP